MQMKQSAVGMILELANTFPTTNRRRSLARSESVALGIVTVMHYNCTVIITPLHVEWSVCCITQRHLSLVSYCHI